MCRSRLASTFSPRGTNDYVPQSNEGSPATPRVSVIIPTSRPEQATHAIESLSRQRYAGDLEIIVVGPPAAELAAHWPVVPITWGHEPARVPHLDVSPVSGSVFYGDGHIASTSRNLGASQASGEVLLFLDDDCTVPAQWVEHNVRALQQPRVGAVGGRIRGASADYFARCTDFTNFGYQQAGHNTDRPIASASLGIHRQAFQAVGGFDENLATSEDTDICYRLQAHGYRTVYCPEIEVTHDHRRDTLGKFLRYNYIHGRAAGLTRKIQYRDRSLKNRLLSWVRFPPVFLLVLPLIATVATSRVVVVNIAEDWGVLGYAPCILMGKLAYEFGVFRQLIAPHPPRGRH